MLVEVMPFVPLSIRNMRTSVRTDVSDAANDRSDLSAIAKFCAMDDGIPRDLIVSGGPPHLD